MVSGHCLSACFHDDVVVIAIYLTCCCRWWSSSWLSHPAINKLQFPCLPPSISPSCGHCSHSDKSVCKVSLQLPLPSPLWTSDYAEKAKLIVQTHTFQGSSPMCSTTSVCASVCFTFSIARILPYFLHGTIDALALPACLRLWRHYDVFCRARCVCVVSPDSAPCSSFATWQIIINFPLAMTTNISVWHVWKYLFAMRATTLYRLLSICMCVHIYVYIVTISWHTSTHSMYTTKCCVATVATRLQAQFIELAN